MSKYTDLITNYHATKPKFKQHIDLITHPISSSGLAMQEMIDAFDIDSAVGVQLDVLGEWIGRSRIIKEMITGVYFAFDDHDLGYDKSIWQGKHDPDAGIIKLSDDVYRIVLKAKIAINKWNGTNENIPDVIDTALANAGLRMQIVDNMDMSINLWIFSERGINSISKEIIAVIKQGYLTIKAAGVRIAEMETPSESDCFFGFDIDNSYITGFDNGSWGVNL